LKSITNCVRKFFLTTLCSRFFILSPPC
jgi:hypothetical protein